MKLFVTPTSPYARFAMIVRLDLGLEEEVELVWTKSRVPDDPMLTFNPSGRIPFLQLADGTGFEETDVIVEYLDRLGGSRRYEPPALDEVGEETYWHFRRIEAGARSMLDGVSVWAREVIRPEGEQSPGIIAHEKRRADRLLRMFEDEIYFAPLALAGDRLSTSQVLLFCALDVHRRLPDMHWRDACPGLSAWYDRMKEIPAVGQSEP